MSKSIIAKLKEIFDISWPAKPFYDEGYGYHVVLTCDDRDKILNYINDAIKEIEQLETKHRWTPVTERLPEKHADYWVCEKHWHGHLRWRGYWMNFFGNKTKYPNPGLITHWKPVILPESESAEELK